MGKSKKSTEKVVDEKVMSATPVEKKIKAVEEVEPTPAVEEPVIEEPASTEPEATPVARVKFGSGPGKYRRRFS